ncbi:hypothetical protein QQP08_008049, partial [Theobroma cacao]
MEVVLSLRGMLAGSMRGALRVIKVKVSAIHIALYDLGPGFIPVNQNNFLSLVLSRFIRCCIQAMFLVK